MNPECMPLFTIVMAETPQELIARIIAGWKLPVSGYTLTRNGVLVPLIPAKVYYPDFTTKRANKLRPLRRAVIPFNRDKRDDKGQS